MSKKLRGLCYPERQCFVPGNALMLLHLEVSTTAVIQQLHPALHCLNSLWLNEKSVIKEDNYA